jgi:hypothetical protein
MSNAVVGALRVDLGLNTAQFQSGLAAASSKASAFARNAAIALGAVAVAMGALTARSINTIGAQYDLAQRLGGTTAAVQGLTRAADLAGVSADAFTTAADKMNKALGTAINNGKGSAGVFAKLGISAAELVSLDIDERFAVIADRIQELGLSGTQAAGLLGELGVRQSEVTNLLIEGGDAIRESRTAVEEFGIAVSEVDAAQIEAAGDAVADIKNIFTGVGNQMAVIVAPAIKATAEALTLLVRGFGSIKPILEDMLFISGALALGFGTKLVAGFVAARVATITLSGALLGLQRAIIATGIGAAILLAAELARKFGDLVKGAGSVGAAVDILKELVIAAFNVMAFKADALGAAFAAIGQHIAIGIINGLNAAGAALDKFFQSTAGELLNLAFPGRGFADDKTVYGAIFGDTAKLEASLAVSTANVKTFNSAATSAAEDVSGWWTYLKDTIAAGATETEGATNAVTSLNESLGDLPETGGGAASALSEVADAAEEIRSPIQSATDNFGEMFASALEGAKSLKDALQQVAVEAVKLAASSVLRGLFGIGTATTGIAALFEGIGGSLFPGYATGTNSARGGMALVGERGPELVNLPRGSQVIPNSDLRGGGGVTLHQTVQISSDVDPAKINVLIARAVPAITRATLAAFPDKMQRGGSYASAVRG